MNPETVIGTKLIFAGRQHLDLPEVRQSPWDDNKNENL